MYLAFGLETAGDCIRDWRDGDFIDRAYESVPDAWSGVSVLAAVALIIALWPCFRLPDEEQGGPR